MGVLFSKRNCVWLMVSSGKKEPYNEALALVGIGRVDSLSIVLTNSSYCTALAGNAEAVAIMKANYKNEISSHNISEATFNRGLNALAGAVGVRWYLYRVIGTTYYTDLVKWTTSGNMSMTDGNDSMSTRGIRMRAGCHIVTDNIVDTAIYGTVVANVSWLGPGQGNIGFRDGTSWCGATTWYTSHTAGIKSAGASINNKVVAIRSECAERDQCINYIYVEPR